jgi:hypothetical protein
MASHTTIIDALNAICVAEGGSGGHRYMIDALNEWSLRRSGTGGHKYSINALNEIAGLIGASTGHKYDVDALNAITVELGGVGGHYYYVDALNAVVDADVVGGGGEEWPPEGAVVAIDFKNGRYWFGAASHTRAETVEENLEWGEFNAANIVEGVGLRVTGSADDFSGSFVLSSGAKDGLLPSDGGFTAVFVFSLAASGTSATSNILIEALDIPGYNLEWASGRTKTVANETAIIGDGDSISDSQTATGNKFVLTMEPIRLAMCWPGSSVFSYDDPADNTAATDIAIQACIYNFTAGTATAVLESVVFYSPQNDAGMLALAA